MKQPHRIIWILLAALAGSYLTAAAADPQPLSDAALDTVTAGSATAEGGEELLIFDVIRTTQSGRTVKADGSLAALHGPAGILAGHMNISDGAQNNLRSIININAVNSAVNVLLNLNISIDSRIDAINQTNLNGLPPAAIGPGGN